MKTVILYNIISLIIIFVLIFVLRIVSKSDLRKNQQLIIKVITTILIVCVIAFLIMVCVGIYSVLVQSIATDGNISGAIWACMGYTVLLCFALFKTGSLSKSLFGAH